MLVFFRCGLIMADFSSSGKHPEDMDELMIAVIIGSSLMFKHCLCMMA